MVHKGHHILMDHSFHSFSPAIVVEDHGGAGLEKTLVGLPIRLHPRIGMISIDEQDIQSRCNLPHGMDDLRAETSYRDDEVPIAAGVVLKGLPSVPLALGHRVIVPSVDANDLANPRSQDGRAKATGGGPNVGSNLGYDPATTGEPEEHHALLAGQMGRDREGFRETGSDDGLSQDGGLTEHFRLPPLRSVYESIG